MLIAVGFYAAHTFRPPEPLTADAHPQLFSAARARAELVRFLGDETPHPIGSDANKRVKARLIERLDELGLQVKEQNAFSCSFLYAVCGPVENVLAQIPGDRESALVLMAHYDSVNMAPGAGDDGAGVAALLEVARVLKTQGAHPNGVVFVFTDGEEIGLLGAEAFFANPTWAKRTLAVVNVEGRGSSGPSLLLRTGPSSGSVMDVFRAVVPYPFAISVASEVLARMPNDTDFSVAARADKPGFDFAFSGEVNHYHSPLDTIANLDSATLQHHGDNVLPLVQALVDADLSLRTPNYVYANVTSALWLAYSPTAGLAAALLAVVLLLFANWRRRQGFARFIGAAAIVALALIAIIALEFGTFMLADRIAGARVAWPAEPWPSRLLLYSVPVFVLALLRPLVHRIGFWSTLFAAWWFWGLLVLAQAHYIPLASHVMLPATLVAAIIILFVSFVPRLDRPAVRSAAALISALTAGYFLLPLVYVLEVTEGWMAAPVLFVPLALVAITLLPLLDRGQSRNAGGGALLVIIIGLGWTHWAPLYSPSRPQQLNFTYTVDVDTGRSTFSAWSPNPLPKAVQAAMPFAPAAAPAPWEDTTLPVAPADAVARPSAVMETLPRTGTTRSYLLRPGASTHVLGLMIDKKQRIDAIRIAGQPISLDPRGSKGFRWAYVVAPPPDGIRIDIDVGGDAPLDAFLIDLALGLPPSGHVLSDARGALAVPVRRGDTWQIFHRVTL